MCCIDCEIRIWCSSGWQIRLHGWCGLDHWSHVGVYPYASPSRTYPFGYRYIVYGPLANGVTTTVFESTPTYPTPARYWETVAKYKLTQFYSAPTAIRLLRRLGEEHIGNHDLSSLRVLGTVGEPINPEAWNWYNEHVGKKQCAIVDTFWSVLFYDQSYRSWHLTFCDMILGKRRRALSSSRHSLVRLKRNRVRRPYLSSVSNLLSLIQFLERSVA